MLLTINITAEEALEQDLISPEVPTDTTIGILKESVQAEFRIPKTSQHLYHNGVLLSDDSKTMEEFQLGDGEMLALHVRDIIGNTGLPPPNRVQQSARRPAAGQSSRGAHGDHDPEVIRLQLLGNPRMRQEALRQQPELAAAIDSPERFAQLYRQLQEQERQDRISRQQQISDLNADPFDVEAQMRIAEMIREERVQENLQNAIEHNPEGGLTPADPLWLCR